MRSDELKKWAAAFITEYWSRYYDRIIVFVIGFACGMGF